MNGAEKSERRIDGVLAGTAVVMVLCCAVGPAVLGAAAGSIIGGWLGIICAIVLAAGVGLMLYSRRGRGKC
jgi:hypothetical protein